MAYKTILLFLLSILIRNICLAQYDTLIQLKSFEKKIDSIVNIAISKEAFPGCVIYASKMNEPFFFKTYGHHTYDSLQKVSIHDLYDLASITKVTASTLALMKLYDDGCIDLDDPIRKYVNGLGWSKFGKATLRKCLAHQAGLTSWIRFYKEIERNSGKYRSRTISDVRSEKYPYLISEGKFLHRNFHRKLKRMIKKANLDPDQGYVYSDLFFYMVPELVGNLSGMNFTDYLDHYFYDSLSANTLTFNPQDQFPRDRIVPTEIDSFFRYEPIHGKVHDEGAILMKGVSGNAGLFGTAGDMAKVWQMLLNGGTYEGKEYLRSQTINLFTSYQFPNNENRRALGFDKPLLEYDSIMSSVAKSASVFSYGHTGFTGTLVWADPTNDFIFIFLSNRVYPSRDHKAIYQLNVRPEIHQILYNCIQLIERYDLTLREQD